MKINKLFILALFTYIGAMIMLSGAKFIEDNENMSIVQNYGLLKTDGNRIVSEQGNKIVLRGMSLFWSQIKGEYYNKECVNWLKEDWNCNVVRAALGVEKADGIDGYLANKEKEYEKIVRVIDAAIELGMYVIIDWHDHNAHKHIEEAKKFFEKISQKYGAYSNIIYEIYNEPLDVSWKEVIKPYAEQVIAVIRKNDPDNLILVGTPRWSQDVDIASEDPIIDNNVAYTLHFYAASHKEELRNKAKVALNNNIALFVSEFGTCEYTGDGIIDSLELEKWLNFLESNKISWCNWAVGDKKESSAALLQGANVNGRWTKDDLSISGLLIKNKIKKLNSSLK